LGIKVIGCTTTGLSKYRGLLSALQPRILLIEEAAETLEGTVIAGMFDSLDRLILVGDHKQLQAHCNVQALEVDPYFLNTSMFERLVNNGIPYTMLNEQRRMISDIRKLLCIEPDPFYVGLHDHPSVLDRQINRPAVPGMGGRDVFFFHHNWPESRNQDFSMVNHDEAEMIAGFFNYLVLNGTPIEKITVLSFYNGQKKRILSQLKSHDSFKGQGHRFNVHTVDSFQGEENDVILLSLVRSNTYLGVGFLESQNRLVVALSRARRGLYLFGNVVTLIGDESSKDSITGVGRVPLWGPLTHYMIKQKQLDIDGGLPLTCQKHNNTVIINEAADFSAISGGCTIKCGGRLPCGHDCTYFCHPFLHEDIICRVPCARLVPVCGHGCSNDCGETCYCAACIIPEQTPLQNIPDPERAGEMEYGLTVASQDGLDRLSNNNSSNSLYDASPKKPAQQNANQDIRSR
jgi:helicase required for RNAi-mediated heterochromatin assembly 1